MISMQYCLHHSGAWVRGAVAKSDIHPGQRVLHCTDNLFKILMFPLMFAFVPQSMYVMCPDCQC